MGKFWERGKNDVADMARALTDDDHGKAVGTLREYFGLEPYTKAIAAKSGI